MPKKEIEKRNLVIFHRQRLPDMDPMKLPGDTPSLLESVASAYQKAITDHKDAMNEPGFRKAVADGKALPPLNKRMDVYLTDLDSSLTKDGRFALQKGWKYDYKKDKWVKWESKKPIDVYAAVARMAYNKKIAEMAKAQGLENEHPLAKRYEKGKLTSLIQHLQANQPDTFFLNDADYGLIAADKMKTLTALKEGGLEKYLPVTHELSNKKQAKQAIGSMDCKKVIIRPKFGTQAKGIVILDKDEAIKRIDEFANKGMFVQEFIPPLWNYSYRLFTKVKRDKDGRVIGNVFAGIGRNGTLGSFSQGAVPEAIDFSDPNNISLRKLARRAAEVLALKSGGEPQFMGIDLGRREDGSPVFVEANTYPGGYLEMKDADKDAFVRVGSALLSSAAYPRRSKKTFLVLTNYGQKKLEEGGFDSSNLRTLMGGLKESYLEALNNFSETLGLENKHGYDSLLGIPLHQIGREFRKALEHGEALPALNDRLDIYFSSVDNAVDKHNRIRIKKGFKLNVKYNKYDNKWEGKWTKVKPKASPKVDIVYTYPKYEKTPMKEFNEWVKKLIAANNIAVVNPPAFADIANYKTHFYELLKDNKEVMMPYTETAYDKNEAMRKIDEFPFEKITLKLPALSSGKGVFFAESKEEAKRILKNLDVGADGIVLQKYEKTIHNDTMRIWSDMVKKDDGKLYTRFMGGIRRIAPPGEKSKFDLGIRYEPIDSKAIYSKKYAKVRKTVSAANKAMAEASGTLPQFIASDIGFDKEGNPLFFDPANYSGGISSAKRTDIEHSKRWHESMVRAIARSFLRAALSL